MGHQWLRVGPKWTRLPVHPPSASRYPNLAMKWASTKIIFFWGRSGEFAGISENMVHLVKNCWVTTSSISEKGGLERDLANDFPYIGKNHSNWLIFFRGVGTPPTSWSWSNHLFFTGKKPMVPWFPDFSKIWWTEETGNPISQGKIWLVSG